MTGSLRLRLAMPFAEAIVFDGFLPEEGDDILRVTLEENRWDIRICVADRATQLRNLHRPAKNEDIGKWQTLYCSALTFEIVDHKPPEDVVCALAADAAIPVAEDYGKSIYHLVDRVHAGIVDFFRNIRQQFWVWRPAVEPDNWANFLLSCDIQWQSSGGSWHPLRIKGDSVVHLTVCFPDAGVDRSTWQQLKEFIERRKPAPMWDVLIANSRQLQREGNRRLAVIEAIIALEAALKQCLSKALCELAAIDSITAKKLDTLVQNAGLRLAAEVGLRLTKDQLGIEEDHISAALEAIDERNTIIHNWQRDVGDKKCRQYVNAIRDIVAALAQTFPAGGQA